MYKKISKFSFERRIVIDPYLGMKIPRVLIDGKIVLPSEEINDCNGKFYTMSKADGARKLYHQIKEHFFGIGEPIIQRYLNKNSMQRQHRPQFNNKAPLIPIESASPMERHQIDLVDMSSMTVEINSEKYKYILSILDVFTRFLWLRPLTSKSANSVAESLQSIYSEFGPPKIIQSDQGTEFKGAVITLCKKMNIKVIRSGSYHPQSQGKVERSHGTWKDKIRYDLLNTEEGVCDWVSELPRYQYIYNEALHSSIGITPYECLFGSKPNRQLLKCNMKEKGDDEIETIIGDVDPDIENNIQKRKESILKIRHKTTEKSKMCSLRMTRKNLSKFPPSEYEIGDAVYVKFIGKDHRVSRGGTSIKAPKVIEGLVIGANKEQHRYKIKCIDNNGKETTNWYCVDKITSKLSDVEKNKQERAKEKNRKRTNISHLKNWEANVVTSTMEILQQTIKESKIITESFETEMKDKKENLKTKIVALNLQLDRETPGDGNCMFHALSRQLQRVGVGISHRKLRKMIIDYLREHPIIESNDGKLDLRPFAYDFDSWESYLDTMENEGEWGDNIILFAAASLFRVEVQIISSLEDSVPITIRPLHVARQETLYLGHLAEWHYVSLLPEETLQSNRNEIIIPLCYICGAFHINDCSNSHVVLSVGNNSQENSDKCSPASLVDSDDLEVSVGKPHIGQDDLSDTLPLHDENVCNFKNSTTNFEKMFDSVNEWLVTRLEQIDDETFQKGVLLNKDEKSMILYHLLKSHGTILQFKREIDDDFLIVSHNLMDLYDDLRSFIRNVFLGLA